VRLLICTPTHLVSQLPRERSRFVEEVQWGGHSHTTPTCVGFLKPLFDPPALLWSHNTAMGRHRAKKSGGPPDAAAAHRRRRTVSERNHTPPASPQSGETIAVHPHTILWYLQSPAHPPVCSAADTSPYPHTHPWAAGEPGGPSLSVHLHAVCFEPSMQILRGPHPSPPVTSWPSRSIHKRTCIA
jgi:hypothetical protein